MCGIYKYKPLKFQKKKNVIYTIIFFVFNKIILMLFLIYIQKQYYLINKNIEFIFLTHGLTFIIQSLITIIFLVPFLLILYDKALATQERVWYFMILTHHPVSASDHTFYLKFGRTYVYFCSRCSGVIIGGMVAAFFTHLTERIYNTQFNPELAVILCILLPIPGLIDWGTQRMLLRKSTTETRLLTGSIIGSALHLMSFTTPYYYFMLFLLVLYFSILFLLMFFGHRKELKLQKQESEDRFPSNREYQINF